MAFLERLKQGLARTRQALADKLTGILPAGRKIDAGTLEALESALLSADLGPLLCQELLQRLKTRSGESGGDLRRLLKEELESMILPFHGSPPDLLSREPSSRPEVMLLAGVNGSGKTTTCGKLARKFSIAGAGGTRVMLVAADTFRAAASDQLEAWADRAGVDVFIQQTGADPSSVVFDALKKAAAGAYGRVLIDTAGRLQTKIPLMEEIKKIHRICGKALPGAPHETLLVLDGTTGQNMISQVRLFQESIPLTGLVITKLDGTAKAGAVLAVIREFKIPVRLIGVGEALEDLQAFQLQEFVGALLEQPEGTSS